MESTKKKVVHHLKKALAEITPSAKPRSRSNSPVRAEKKETVAHEKKERKKREPKEKPAKIHVCREKKTGLYKKCATPKKETKKK